MSGGGVGEINTPGSSAVAKRTNLLRKLGARHQPLCQGPAAPSALGSAAVAASVLVPTVPRPAAARAPGVVGAPVVALIAQVSGPRASQANVLASIAAPAAVTHLITT